MNADHHRRVREVFLAAVSLAPAQRVAYVERECAGDDRLRHDVEALITADAGSGTPIAHIIREAAARAAPQQFLHRWVERTAVQLQMNLLSASSAYGLSRGALRTHPLLTDSEPATIPDRIGRYDVMDKLGAGGMGVVYLGVDSTLGRQVAIKVVSGTMADDERALRRLQEEARLLASLNHANVATLYSLEDADSYLFLTMEVISGRSIAECIPEQGLGIDETLRIASQLAAAIEAAHARGIVHRDLKPTNVMLTDDGVVKVLDFGLAKLVAPGIADVAEAAAPHRSLIGSPAHTRGTRLAGTPGYMSPEQLGAGPVDHRTDIWSFGCIVYECLTGKPAFKGTADERVLSTLVEDLDPESLPADVPDPLRRLITSCVTREVDDRLSPIGTVRSIIEQLIDERSAERALESSSAAGSHGGDAGTHVAERGRRSGMAWRLVAAGVGTLLIVAALSLWRPLLDSRTLPAGQLEAKRLTAFGAQLGFGDISPDGRLLAVPHDDVLDVIDIETGESKRFAGPDPCRRYARWMPDSRTLLCWECPDMTDEADLLDRFWLRDVVLGTSHQIFAGEATYPVPSPDGKQIAFLRETFHELWVMDASGHNPRKIRELPLGKGFFTPAWSHDAHRLAYVTVYRDSSRQKVADLETTDLDGETSMVFAGDAHLDSGGDFCNLRWLPDDRLVFSRKLAGERPSPDALWTIRVDPRSGRSSGEPTRLLGFAESSMRQFTASADGRRLAFYRMQQIETMPLLELDARGDSAGVRHVASQHWPGTRPCAWTRDGSRIVFSVGQSTGDRDIYIRDVATGVDRSFVKTDAFEIPQCLTPDGEDLIFWQGDRLRSRALSGGPAVDVLRAPESTVHPDDTVLCPAEGDQPCVIATIERTTIVFRELEVEDGTLGPEIARIEVATDAIDQMVDFDLSPDGTRVAVAECVDPFYRLRIVDLRDGSIDELERDWSGRGPQYLAWSRDGRWLCITGMSEGVFWLRRLDLDGGSRHLWGSYDAWPSHPVPSPDGTRIAFRAWRSPADVWMIEDF